MDTVLCLSHYPPKTALKYHSTPDSGMISLSKSKCRVLLGYDDQLELWQLGTPNPNTDMEKFFTIKEDRVKLVSISVGPKESIQCCHISPGGSGIAYATGSKLKLFKFTSPSVNNYY